MQRVHALTAGQPVDRVSLGRVAPAGQILDGTLREYLAAGAAGSAND